MIAAQDGHSEVVKFLTRHGADTRAEDTAPGRFGTAAELAAKHAAAPELAEWLEARYCANPACDQAANDKCPNCLEARYCGRECASSTTCPSTKRSVKSSLC